MILESIVKKFGIKFWDKPSNSCLATRFPYNTDITKEDLKKVEKGEEIIKELGIQKVRLRAQSESVRIEVDKENFEVLINNKDLVEKIKKLGFKFISLDLEGLKSGSFD